MKKLLVTLLALIATFCFVGCFAPKLEAQPAPDDLYYEFTEDYSQLYVEADGENLEYSIDGVTWQDSNYFDIELETEYKPSARFKKTDKYDSGAIASETICSKPDESKISVAATPEAYGSITIDIGDNANIYEFSVELSEYSDKLVWEVSKTEVNVRARLKKTAERDFCDTISIDVTDVPENPDKDYMTRISVSHDASKSSEVVESTDAIGMNQRDGVINFRSIKIFNDSVENNFSIRIAPRGDAVGVSADIKIVCEGYDDTAIKMIDNDVDRVNWKLLGVTQVNEWKSIVMPTGYVAFDVPACDTAVAGTFAVYIDNIKDLSADEVELYNDRSTKLIDNTDTANTQYLDPQTYISNASDPEASKNLVTYFSTFLFTSKRNWSWRMGLVFNNLNKITDISNYDGVSFYVWMDLATLDDAAKTAIAEGKELTFTFKLNAKVVDNVSYNTEANGTRWNLNDQTVAGQITTARDGYQRVKISKQALIDAGYDLTNFTTFSLLFIDVMDGATGTVAYKHPMMFISDLEAYKD